MNENKNALSTDIQTIEAPQVSHDLRTAVLIVSVIANLFVFTAWLTLQVTTQYDAQIANFLFTR